MNDHELLRAYVEHRSQEAFRQLVGRHLPMVCSAARRMVRDAHLAEEVAQNVFTTLAQKADSLRPPLVIGGWLYHTTRHLAMHAIRTEQRRREREQTALAMQTPDLAADDPRIAENLEPALAGLDAADRDALVLRYLENRSLREVGVELGLSEDAARMRVNRALERLRAGFERQGVVVTSVFLATAVTATTTAVPAGLAATITTAALAGTTLATATTATATAIKTLTMTTLQKSLIAVALVATSATIYEAHQASTLRSQVHELRQQQATSPELQQLIRDHDDVTRQFAALRGENENLNRNAIELMRLRNEVGRLRADSEYLARVRGKKSDRLLVEGALAWLERADKLKLHLDRTPGAKIPELQFVITEEWLTATAGDFRTEIQQRRAASKIRSTGERVVGDMFFRALARYGQTSNGQFPTELDQLQPYFERSKGRPQSDSPIEDVAAIFQRWEIVPAARIKGLVAGGHMVITQKAPVDDVFDSRVVVGSKGNLTGDFARTDTWDTMEPVHAAFRAANAGRWSSDESQLLPYVSTPEQESALQKLILSRKQD